MDFRKRRRNKIWNRGNRFVKGHEYCVAWLRRQMAAPKFNIIYIDLQTTGVLSEIQLALPQLNIKCKRLKSEPLPLSLSLSLSIYIFPGVSLLIHLPIYLSFLSRSDTSTPQIIMLWLIIYHFRDHPKTTLSFISVRSSGATEASRIAILRRHHACFICMLSYKHLYTDRSSKAYYHLMHISTAASTVLLWPTCFLVRLAYC